MGREERVPREEGRGSREAEHGQRGGGAFIRRAARVRRRRVCVRLACVRAGCAARLAPLCALQGKERARTREAAEEHRGGHAGGRQKGSVSADTGPWWRPDFKLPQGSLGSGVGGQRWRLAVLQGARRGPHPLFG